MARNNGPSDRKSKQVSARFDHRNFSERTIKTLIACAIDSPERLLFLHEDTLTDIPGVGAVAMSEISKYRAKFSR
jgi:hypothetical protein